MSVSPARAVAFATIRRTFEQDAFTDRALRAEAQSAGVQSGRDFGLATTLAFGTVQRRATLDYVITELTGRAIDRFDGRVLAALRLGLFQILFLDRIPSHAAVDESVELAKPSHGAGLVNAVLRRAGREGPALLDALGDETPQRAAVKHSVPLWLAQLWWDELGAQGARDLLAVVNEPAEAALRVNTLVASADEVVAELTALGVASHEATGLPEGLVLDDAFDVHGSELWARGAVMAQSRASMLVARLVDPTPGERVLDLCAAPGAKTTHLAALMEGEGEIVAVERHAGRAGSLVTTCARMQATIVGVEVSDAGRGRDSQRKFDRVLVDPPCSGLGTLQSRPDLRWRVTAETITALAGVQAQILTKAADALAPGGTLVYSVCTISAAEGAHQIDSLLAQNPALSPDDLQAAAPLWENGEMQGPVRDLATMPHRHATDGFSISRLRLSGG